MNNERKAGQINAFVDCELDLTRQLEMEDLMVNDRQVRDEVQAIRSLQEAVREGAEYHAAPAEFRSRMIALTRPQTPQRQKSVSRPAAALAIGRWLGFRPMGVALCLITAVALTMNVALLKNSGDSRLLDDVVASHVRSTLGQHLVDVVSSDHHTVKPWLSSKLDFSPPVSELAIPGSTFIGGRVDYIDGHPVAALVYKQGEHVVNSFVWPSNAKDSKPEFSLERGFQTAHWTSTGMDHWVISDVNRKEFGVVVQAIQVSSVVR